MVDVVARIVPMGANRAARMNLADNDFPLLAHAHFRRHFSLTVIHTPTP